jgi:hypothetical protein
LGGWWGVNSVEKYHKLQEFLIENISYVTS